MQHDVRAHLSDALVLCYATAKPARTIESVGRPSLCRDAAEPTDPSSDDGVYFPRARLIPCTAMSVTQSNKLR